jgi:hypothetical protein
LSKASHLLVLPAPPMTHPLISAATRVLGERRLGQLEHMLRPRLANAWGGPFNGQDMRQKIYRGILERFGPEAIIETGTFRGATTELFAHARLPVFSIEANARYRAFAERRLRCHSHVELLLADSRSGLTQLAARPQMARDRVFFYLDAHWSEDLPLRDEVAIITSRWSDSVIMVDDFEVPGTDYRYDDYGPGQALTIDYLRPLEAPGLTCFFPAGTVENETGARRGCVVLAHGALAREALQKVTELRIFEDLAMAPGP